MRFLLRSRGSAAATAIAGVLAGCAQTPLGTAVQVMPGPGKSFDVFATDQTACKTFAGDQVAGQADAANKQAVGGAALATLIGAGAGAAFGNVGRGGAGRGAGVGAAAGVATGAAVGAQSSQNAQGFIQAQYDTAYSQCMYARGNVVPGYAPMAADAGPAPAAYSGPDPALVRSVQAELGRVGYLDSSPDGVVGPHTRSAINSFERSSGMSVNGAVSPRLLARLQASPTGSAVASAARPPDWVAPSAAAPAAASAQASAQPTWVSPAAGE